MKHSVLHRLICISLYTSVPFVSGYAAESQPNKEVLDNANNALIKPKAVDLGNIEVVALRKSLPKVGMKKHSMATSTQNTGASIPAISTHKTSIQNLGQSTANTLDMMPGVSIMGGARSVTQNISVGGLSGDRVYVAIDGINNNFASFGHNQTRLLPSAFLYKEVNVSQSGSNITYGSGDLGGAVNFTTLDPEDFLDGKDFGGQLSLGGATGDKSGNANTALAFKTGPVSYLFDVVGARANNMRLGNGETLQNSANNDLQYLAKVNVDISDDQWLKLSFLSMQNVGQYPASTNKSTSSTNPPSNFNYFQTQSMAEYQFDPGNPYVNFNAKLYYNENHFASNPVNNGGGFALPQSIHVNTTGIKLLNRTTLYQQHFLYGVDYSYINGYDTEHSNTSANFPTANQQQYSAYLQDSWDILPELNLTIGGRYNGYQSQSGSNKNSDGRFTKQASLRYKFYKDYSVFAAYTEGFRAPSIQELYLGGNHPTSASGPVFLTFLPNPNLAPEYSQNKTVGIEGKQIFANKQSIAASASVFLNDVKNYILNATVTPGFPQVNQNINIPEARLYGYNLSINYQNPFFSILSNFTYTRGTSESAYTNENGASIPAGSALPIPRAKGLVSLMVPISLIDSNVTTTMQYALRQNNVPAGTAEVPGYALLNINYTYKPRFVKGLVFSIGVNNLLDQYYQDYDGTTLVSAMGRSIYGQMTYRF